MYEELKQASHKELLEAAIDHYSQFYNKDCIDFLKLGFKIAQKEGWQEIAPAWLRESKKERN